MHHYLTLRSVNGYITSHVLISHLRHNGFKVIVYSIKVSRPVCHIALAEFFYVFFTNYVTIHTLLSIERTCKYKH